MKLSSFSSLLTTAALALGLYMAPTAQAQEPVSTGVVQEVVAATGVLTIRSDQTQRAITFYGLNTANIFTVQGAPAQLSDLQTGTPVTVQYAIRDNRWFVSKVMFSAAGSGGAGTGTSTGAATGSAGMPQLNQSTSVSGGIPDRTSNVRPVRTVNGTSPGGQ